MPFLIVKPQKRKKQTPGVHLSFHIQHHFWGGFMGSHGWLYLDVLIFLRQYPESPCLYIHPIQLCPYLFEEVVTHFWPHESYPKQNSLWPLGMPFVLRLRMIIDVNPLALKPKQHPGFQFMILMLLASPSITKRDFAKNLSHYPCRPYLVNGFNPVKKL